MFGFLAPQTRIPKWRQCYARICQYQRKLFGLTSLPFLSYEAAFLYQLVVDLKVVPAAPEDAPQCCRLRKLRTEVSDAEHTAATWCAAFGLILAGVKLQDDVQDSGKLQHRLVEWKYRRQVSAAREQFDRLAPDVTVAIDDAIQRHAALESNSESISLPDFATPTAEAFAAVFRGLGTALADSADSDLPEKLAACGQCVGHAIISWDCAVDFAKDKIRGEFNPLTTDADVNRSFDHCLLSLAELGWQLPQESVSQLVIAQVQARVRTRKQRPPRLEPVPLLERWGLLRQRGYAYAKCDGCEICCAAGECCECAGAAGEGCAACGAIGECCAFSPECTCCCCDMGCTVCFEAQSDSAKAKKAAQLPKHSTYELHIGAEGTADSYLNPTGYVRLGDIIVPGKSQTGTFIPPKTAIRVVAADTFGVLVVALNNADTD